MLSNVALKKEDGNEIARTCSYERFVGVMSHANVEWKELYGEFGKDIKAKIINKTITKGELFDVCTYLKVDYRYVTMEREDFNYNVHDFVTDPRVKDADISFLKEEEHASDARKPAKASVKRRKAHPYGSAKQRESNNINADRLKKLMDAEGISYNFLREFLGVTPRSLNMLLITKTLPLHTTENIAWFLETTPDYLTGTSNISWLGAEDVTRHVLKTQKVLLDGDALAKYRSELHADTAFSQELILWMTAKDSMVSQEFAERIASSIGLKNKVSAIISKDGNLYRTEPSLVKFCTTSKFQEKCEVREKALESVPSDTESVSSEPVPADNESVQGTELPEESIQNVSMFISEPISAEPVQELSESVSEESAVSAEPVPAEETDAESDSGLIPKDMLDYIEGMSDDELELLSGYVKSMKTARTFKKKLRETSHQNMKTGDAKTNEISDGNMSHQRELESHEGQSEKEAYENNPLVRVVRKLLEQNGKWRGNAKKFTDASDRCKILVSHSPKKLKTELKSLAPDLFKYDSIVVDINSNGNGGVNYSLCYAADAKPEKMQNSGNCLFETVNGAEPAEVLFHA